MPLQSARSMILANLILETELLLWILQNNNNTKTIYRALMIFVVFCQQDGQICYDILFGISLVARYSCITGYCNSNMN